MRPTLKRQIVIIAFLFIQYGTTWSQDILSPYLITTDTTLEYKFTRQQYQILPDKTGELTIEQVRNGESSKLFSTKDKTPIGVDTMVNTTWYLYSVKNNLDREIGISLVARSLQSDFFVIRNNTEQIHYESGIFVPWDEKDGLQANNFIPIKIQAGEDITIYNRVENDRPGTQFGFQVKLYNTENYSLKRLGEMQSFFHAELALFFPFFGLCLLAGILNFLLFRIDRQKVNLYFSMYLLGLALYYSPLYYIYIVRNAPFLMRWFNFTTTSLIVISFIQFTRYYFQSFINTPRFDKFLVVLIFLQLIPILTLFDLLPDSSGTIIPYGTLAISIITSFIIFNRLKHPNIKSFTWALLPFGFASLFAMIMFVFLNEGGGYLFAIGMILTVGWSVVYFTWILFKQYNTQKRLIIQQAFDAERIAKEKEIERNTLIEQQKIELEKTVQERTAELRQSIEDLRSTQKQLIQSEKMASLGELTAGIAHEIQNPLNFVNNFSEVSNELIKEIQDIRRKTEENNSNTEEDELLNDIAGNLEKINHHGKRAADIVKGMLQHSRSSSGVKEPMDINALCDEYLRLSYHGLRAKDKNFNAKFETNLDPTLPKVNVVPQDIGRVVLNLINNAFYAVNEKSKREISNVKGEPPHISRLTSVYEPLVIVRTKKVSDKIEISVKDNGNGIAENIKDKIFQPFFTTKPTGQGTGLGLSLSYDIVKAHGGELKVETIDGEGSTLIMQLPNI